jgi:hypothetical protein
MDAHGECSPAADPTGYNRSLGESLGGEAKTKLTTIDLALMRLVAIVKVVVFPYT